MGECNRTSFQKPAFLDRDRLAQALGIQLVEIKEGYGKTAMTVTETHLNGLDHTQGGAVFTLADYAFAAASNSWGIPAVGVSCTISYIKGFRLGGYFDGGMLCGPPGRPFRTVYHRDS